MASFVSLLLQSLTLRQRFKSNAANQMLPLSSWSVVSQLATSCFVRIKPPLVLLICYYSVATFARVQDLRQCLVKWVRMTPIAQFTPAIDYRMSIRKQYQSNINGNRDMDQLEMGHSICRWCWRWSAIFAIWWCHSFSLLLRFLQGFPGCWHIIHFDWASRSPKENLGRLTQSWQIEEILSPISLISLISLIRSSLGSLHYFRHLRCDFFVSYRYLAFPLSPFAVLFLINCGKVNPQILAH